MSMTSQRHQLPAWQRLMAHQQTLAHVSIATLFAADAQRASALRFEAAGLHVDLSRHRLTHETLQALLALAASVDVESWRDRLFAGEALNHTEDRAATHTALRSPSRTPQPFLAFAQRLRAGEVRASAGEPIDTVVCLGIGGSDLGPRLITQALGPGNGPRVRFVTTIDPTELDEALVGAHPQRTAIIITSKSFTTLEPLENLRAAAAWLRAGGVSRLQDHLWAITAHPERAQAFAQSLGCELRPDALMTFEPTIGGRYSVWSACGLPIAIAHGADVFEQLLVGAAAMDAHFCAAPLARNVPVLLALLTIWYTNFWGVRARAVMPYARQLRTLPAYLQQLEMESAGKRVDRSGQLIDYDTTPIVWGDEGTTAQHSVFQFLHQGTHWLPVDFIVNRAFAQSREPRQRLLYLSALAQADALAFGDTVLPTPSQQPRPTWAQAPGNRPSTLIELPQIDASALGALLALYEHRTFVTTVLWDINAFDQWGVEIGKKLLALRLQQQESIP